MNGGAKMTVGSRAQVFHGTAKRTSGGLVKKDLCRNKHGRIVSCKKQKLARSQKNLGKHLRRKGSKGFGPATAKKSKVARRNKTSKRRR